MTESFFAIAPVFVLILLGWLLKRARFAPDAFWAGLDRLTYFILLPCLLIYGLATANLTGVPVGNAILVVSVSILIVFALIRSLRGRLAPKPGAYGALVQCSLRGNNYPVLAIVLALFDDIGLSAFALALIAFVPLTNLISVIVMVRTGKANANAPSGPMLILRQVVLNPILIAVAIGLVLNLLDTGIPAPIDDMVQILGRAALPLGLLAVGAGLTFAGMGGRWRVVGAAVLFKLLLLPALVLVGLNNLGLEGAFAAALLVNAAVPCSVSTYALARQLRGDAKTTAGMIAMQTLVSILTLPLWLWIKDWFI